MKRVTVLPASLVRYFIIFIDSLKKTGKTALFLLLGILLATVAYPQSEKPITTTDTSKIEQKQKQDSLNQLKQQQYTLREDTQQEIQLRKIRQRIDKQQNLRNGLIYTSLILAIVLLVGIFTLNYYQGKRKIK